MELGFLFLVFLVGIIVACFQDLKRREVDNWLNLFLLVVSFSFIFYRAIFEGNGLLVIRAGFVLVLMFAVMSFFYYGRVFAGGDAKLLFAMTVFFVGESFYSSIINVGLFLILLMFSGSVYGLVYSFVLYFKNFEKVNKEMRKLFLVFDFWFLVFLFLVLALGFVNFWFLVFGAFGILVFLFYIFTKGIEGVAMIRVVSGRELREGDWLVEDVKVGKKVVKADWDGLSLENVKLLKGRKRIKIKEGLPFVPAFLIAFLIYVFLRGFLVNFI